ncbi:MAG: type III-B CRISPR-associated protein Cas10/Cmr2, partial [Anaerolineae bacterium]|nr:type III-B CRISPR-associated protein Cas10/Cmr2 [Anaerolineae bacterium]
MNYLFQCAIGPVQEFIATARRSRDLWYGSWLLSELSKAAAKAVIDGGGKLIFPFTDDTAGDLAAKSKFNAPNKIAAVIGSSPQIMADSVEAVLRARLQELSQDAFRKPRGHPFFNQKLAEA